MLETLITMQLSSRAPPDSPGPKGPPGPPGGPPGRPDMPVYDYTENNAPNLTLTTSFLFGVALFIVLLRSYVRVIMTKTIGNDDWTMLLALVGTIVVYVCMMKEIHYGTGRHAGDPILMANNTALMYLSFIRAIFIVFAISVTKISVGFFLLRVVDGTKYRRYIQGMIIFLVLFTISCIGTLVFQCWPVRAAWDFSLRKSAKCYSSKVFIDIALFNGAINIATDFFFAVLPIPVIWSLNVNLQTKISLIIILSLGFFACAAAIVKEVLISTFFTTPDHSYKNTYAIWNFVELCVGIYAACLPALRPLFSFILDKANTTFNSGGATGSNKTSHKYYMQSNDINLSSLPNDKSGVDRYGVTVTGQPRATPKSKLERSLADDDSQEYILSPENEAGRQHGRGIMVKKDVDIR